MRFVQRDESGAVVGHFANEQPYAAESLPDDHPDIEAYRARERELANPPVEVHVAGTLRRSPYARGLTRVLVRQLGIPYDELLRMIAEAAQEGPASPGNPFADEG